MQNTGISKKLLETTQWLAEGPGLPPTAIW